MSSKELRTQTKKVLTGEVLGPDDYAVYAIIIDCDCNKPFHYRYRNCDVLKFYKYKVIPKPCFHDLYCDALYFNFRISWLRGYPDKNCF